MAERRIVFRPSFFGLLSAIPNFAIASTFLITWIDPERLGEQMVRRFMYIMLIEFLVVHSTGFLGALAFSTARRRRKALAFGGLVLLYSLFAAGFSMAHGSFWPLWTFWGLTLAKFPAVVLDPPPENGPQNVGCLWPSWWALTCSVCLPR